MSLTTIRRAHPQDADAISRIAGTVQALHAAAAPTVFQQDAAIAAEHGISRIGLDVWTFNERARAFYRANGFAVMREELWSDRG